MTDFLKRKFNVNYKSGEASSVYWRTVGGTMTDWVYEGLGVVRTYILELLRWAMQDEIVSFTNASSGCRGEDTDLCHFQFSVEIAR